MSVIFWGWKGKIGSNARSCAHEISTSNFAYRSFKFSGARFPAFWTYGLTFLNLLFWLQVQSEFRDSTFEGCLYAGCLKSSILLSNIFMIHVRASLLNNLKTAPDPLLGINWMLSGLKYFITANIQATWFSIFHFAIIKVLVLNVIYLSKISFEEQGPTANCAMLEILFVRDFHTTYWGTHVMARFF